MLKIIFMGTPDFAKESLKAIQEAGHSILAVVTNPDKPKGRGMKMIASPVKEYALEKGIPVYQPEKIRNNTEFLSQIQKLNPDVICVVAYGKILPENLLNIPQWGCINVHGSLLPKYRGAAPIQWAVLNGEKVTGITTMYMDAGMDTGDIIFQEQVTIGEDETTGELWEALSKIGGKLLVKTLEAIEKREAPRVKQEGTFTLAPMLEKEVAKIDWQNKSSLEIKNLVRGLNPIMGAYTYFNGKKLKLWKVQTLTEQQFLNIAEEKKKEKLPSITPGTIVFVNEKEGLYIKTKDGILQVLEIQAENAKRMKVEDFLRGNKLEVGTILE